MSHWSVEPVKGWRTESRDLRDAPFPFLQTNQEISMKTKLALSAIVAAVAVFSQGAFAQASSPTRAEVKAQAKTGALAPAGEGPMASQPSKMSDKTRAERKAQTKSDRKTGALKPSGEAAELKDSQPAAGSMTTRADRKATTKAEAKAGKLQPAGEAAQPVGDAPKK
jgi:hypothetical protein